MKKISFIMVLVLFSVMPVAGALAVVPADGSDPVVQSEDIGNEGAGDMAFAVEDVSDPLEPVNRVLFEFNDIFYSVLLRPVSTVYSQIIPEPARVGVRNFFQNLATPTHFVSALLQGKVEQSGVELSRFGINTVFGLLGFLDVAEHVGLKGAEEDLGQTLGRYGAGDTLYLVWPILGPSNLRDSVGLVGDTLLNPLTYFPGDVGYRAGLVAHRTVNETSLHLGEYEDLKKSAMDPYVSLRDAYLQRRHTQIRE
ncbi:MAG: VacJ family lipoprotein [Magnetococcales bacterium]|nr:VacJ family lipoprotein [Magnetococcales bacterium]